VKTIRLGAGAGYSGDRIEPAAELAEHGDLDYLVFECLAERTIALAQQARWIDPAAGYDPLLAERMMRVLRPCRDGGVRIITNMGAANPRAAAAEAARIARQLGISGLRIAAVSGDDVMDVIHAGNRPLIDRDGDTHNLDASMISANAYLGAGPIVSALADGADVVITGRVGDPAMFLAPLIHEFGWAMDDWQMLGRGTAVGHLLECAGQITGGYFADPGLKDVVGLARLGFPLAEVDADGDATITKVPGSGGAVTLATCAEQLLYEVHDPARYLQPDVVADFSQVRLSSEAYDHVRVTGATGHPATGLLKVSIGYRDGFIGEGQMSYTGLGARARAELALDIIRERLKIAEVNASEWRFEMIGVNAMQHDSANGAHAEPSEVRIRVVGRTSSMSEAVRIGNEVETLYTNGPAGGGGASRAARETIAVSSTLIPADLVKPDIHWEIG
jgi:hypothetical protein